MKSSEGGGDGGGGSPPSNLKRTIGLFQATIFGIGLILGAEYIQL